MSEHDEDLADVVARLLKADPSLRDLYDEHLRDWGELNPYLFMGELIRQLTARVLAGRASEVSAVMRVAEDVFEHGTDAQRDLIGVGFLESFPAEGEQGDGLRRAVRGPLRLQMLRWVR